MRSPEDLANQIYVDIVAGNDDEAADVIRAIRREALEAAAEAADLPICTGFFRTGCCDRTQAMCVRAIRALAAERK